MKVYFDKENYISFLKASTESDIARDTLRMIKNQLSIHLNFDLNGLNEEEFILHEEFEEGVSAEFVLTKGNDAINRPLKKDSFPENIGVYLLNEDTTSIKRLHTVLIGSLNEEVDILSKLIINKDYSFHKEKRIGKDITPDHPLNIEDLPFSTLVVIDRYMFKGPELGGNLGLFEFNLDKILKKVYQDKMGVSKLIFVYQVNVGVTKENKNYDEGPDLEKLAKKIKNITNKHCPSPEIIFVGVPAGSIEDEHDRFIISNYLRIKSGDTYVYFDSKGDIESKSLTVDAYSMAYRAYRETTNTLVDKINSICNETIKKHERFTKCPAGTDISRIIKLN